LPDTANSSILGDSFPKDQQPGGWGISLVRRLARRMDYERPDGITVLTIEIFRD
jgi:hypothetical protein